MERVVRERGRKQERDGGAALPLIKGMILGRANCARKLVPMFGTVLSGVLSIITVFDCYSGRAGPSIHIHIYKYSYMYTDIGFAHGFHRRFY